MKFILQPRIYLTTKPQTDNAELRKFLADNDYSDRFADADIPSDGERAIAEGSRICYGSYDAGKPHGEHIKHLIRVGHGSCLEHAVYGMIITGVSRSLSHELVRHRHFSPSQLSQRYCEHLNFVVPPALIPAWEKHTDFHGIDPCRIFQESCQAAALEYKWWLKYYESGAYPNKKAKEAARAVLPNCTETRIKLTGNLRTWRNFIEQRYNEHADAEIQRLAKLCYEKLSVECPNVFGDYEANADGIRTPYRKV